MSPRTVLLSLLTALTLVLALPGAAHARETALDGNTLGSYYCNIDGEADRLNVDWKCGVRDKDCDGDGVYVAMSISFEPNTEGYHTGSRFRITENAPGCGESEVMKRWKTENVERKIHHVNIYLCRDRKLRSDVCYEGTHQTAL